jgi:hypothetical protein
MCVRSGALSPPQPRQCDDEVDRGAFRMIKEAEELEAAGDATAAAALFRRAFRTSPALAKIYGM